jgi:hypothetical protein
MTTMPMTGTESEKAAAATLRAIKRIGKKAKPKSRDRRERFLGYLYPSDLEDEYGSMPNVVLDKRSNKWLNHRWVEK